MLTIREVIKTFYNALLQRLKKHRGDWNQNDPTADDYIKNRPFYTDDTKKIVNVPEQKITISSESLEAKLVLPELIEFVVGQTYEVKWDDKTYSCVAFDMHGISVIGNQGVLDGGTDTGEPFIMMISKAHKMGIVEATTPEAIGTHTVEVTITKVVKLDKKYLPNEALTGVKTVNGIEPDDTGNVAVEIPAGGVQTVNGVAPDENGNVSVEIDLSNYMTLNTDQAVSDKHIKYKHIQGGFSIRQTGNTNMYPCTYIGYDDLLGDCVEIRHTVSRSSALLNRDSDGTGRLRLYNGRVQDSYATLSPTYLEFKRYNGYRMNLSADNRGNMIVGAGEVGTNRALIKNVANPINDTDAATKEYIDRKISDNAIIINSSTADSNKRFKITVDDSGTLTATEVTE